MVPKKKPGPAPAGKGTQIQVRLQPPDLAALDAYASDEALNRPQAIRAALADWLRTHGYGPQSDTKSSGPATRVVADMDTAIKEHKKGQRISPAPKAKKQGSATK